MSNSRVARQTVRRGPNFQTCRPAPIRRQPLPLKTWRFPRQLTLSLSRLARCRITRRMQPPEQSRGILHLPCSGVSDWSGILPGGEFNGGTNTRIIAADRVNAGQFELYLAGTGFFKLTSNGASCAAGAAVTSIPSGGAGFNAGVGAMSVPGVASEFWVAVGAGGNPGSQPPNEVSGLAYSTDGGTTITPVSNISGALAVGFGKHANGQTDRPCTQPRGTKHQLPGNRSQSAIQEPQISFCRQD